MDLGETLHKHAEWKTKFRAAMIKKETLDAATIGKDNCCELGKWLHGDGKRSFGELASYSVCVEKHANFHKEAGKVATLINARKYDEAELALGLHSAYGQASNAVATAIVRLRKEGGL
jgi:hypothetical protein